MLRGRYQSQQRNDGLFQQSEIVAKENSNEAISLSEAVKRTLAHARRGVASSRDGKNIEKHKKQANPNLDELRKSLKEALGKEEAE